MPSNHLQADTEWVGPGFPGMMPAVPAAAGVDRSGSVTDGAASLCARQLDAMDAWSGACPQHTVPEDLAGLDRLFADGRDRHLTVAQSQREERT